MASVKKFTHNAVVNELRHNNREIKNDSNGDIDPSRTHLNYSLTPDRKMSEYQYYKKRKSELYCYNRADVKTLAGWIVTAPAELETEEQIKNFFKATSDFLTERYGEKNVVSVKCHFDEGKMEKVKDRWGEYERDENGKIKKELVLGRPHLHFLFIPVVEDMNDKHFQTEKICCDKVLTKIELKRFHNDLAKATNCPYVINGKTKAQGRNYTVEEMKEKYEMEKEMQRLREIERKYILERERKEAGGRWR